MINLQDAKEKLLTIAVFTGIFLPVRLFFYTYISEFWIGSFGVMTALLLGMMYLSHKDKLGYIGKIIKKQVNRFSKGKVGKLLIVQYIIFIYIFSNAIYGIEFPSEERKAEFIEVLSNTGVTDIETLAEESGNLGWSNLQIPAFLFSIIIILVPNSIGHAFLSILNDFSNGWILHFVTVFLVEDLEILGLMLYFRYKHN